MYFLHYMHVYKISKGLAVHLGKEIRGLPFGLFGRTSGPPLSMAGRPANVRPKGA